VRGACRSHGTANGYAMRRGVESAPIEWMQGARITRRRSRVEASGVRVLMFLSHLSHFLRALDKDPFQNSPHPCEPIVPAISPSSSSTSMQPIAMASHLDHRRCPSSHFQSRVLSRRPNTQTSQTTNCN